MCPHPKTCRRRTPSAPARRPERRRRRSERRPADASGRMKRAGLGCSPKGAFCRDGERDSRNGPPRCHRRRLPTPDAGRKPGPRPPTIWPPPPTKCATDPDSRRRAEARPPTPDCLDPTPDYLLLDRSHRDFLGLLLPEEDQPVRTLLRVGIDPLAVVAADALGY